MAADRNDRNAQPGGRGRIAALILVLVLAGGLYLIGQAIIQHNAMQNCIDSGRRDCETRAAP